MNVSEKALEFACPACLAEPREECHRIDGYVMSQPHSVRTNLVLGIKPRNRREDVSQALARIQPSGVSAPLPEQTTKKKAWHNKRPVRAPASILSARAVVYITNRAGRIVSVMGSLENPQAVPGFNADSTGDCRIRVRRAGRPVFRRW